MPSRAQSYTSERRRRSRRNSQFSTNEWALVESVLREDYSPAQVVGGFARFEIVTISHETIYRHIMGGQEGRRDAARASPPREQALSETLRGL